MNPSEQENEVPDALQNSSDQTVPAQNQDVAVDQSSDQKAPADLKEQLNVFSQALIDQLHGFEAVDFAGPGSEIAAPEPDLEPAQTRNAQPDTGVAEHLEEIADDMLALMRRVRSIEDGQQALIGCINQLQDTWSQATRTLAREVDTLRRDVVGDRKHLAATGVFNELIPMIDRFRTMRFHLDDDEDARMVSQLDGVLETLSTCLRRLGCEEFEAPIGAPFDPSHMECAECVSPGEVCIVLESTRPGYLFGELVLRPVSVTIGASASPANDEAGENCDE